MILLSLLEKETLLVAKAKKNLIVFLPSCCFPPSFADGPHAVLELPRMRTIGQRSATKNPQSQPKGDLRKIKPVFILGGEKLPRQKIPCVLHSASTVTLPGLVCSLEELDGLNGEPGEGAAAGGWNPARQKAQVNQISSHFHLFKAIPEPQPTLLQCKLHSEAPCADK